MISEHAVQLFGKSVFTACKVYQPVNIMLHRPEILPSVAFTNMRCIVIRLEIFDKVTFVIPWLHERCCGVVDVLIVLGTFVECVCNVLLTHLLGHFGNAVIVKGIFQRFG